MDTYINNECRKTRITMMEDIFIFNYGKRERLFFFFSQIKS